MSEWKKIKLKEVLKEVNEKNKGEKVKIVLSVTNSQGFVNQEEYFEGTVHSNNISNYKIVRKNQFAYNPSRVNVGSIDILKNYDEGSLSPMYVVFEVDTTKLLPEYFKYYFQTNRFYENVKNNTQGSVRNSLSFKALSDFEYLLPSIEEQEKIVKILKNIDSIIEKYESLLEEKNKFIKSQFVEMFENEDFEICKLNEVCDVRDGTHDSPSYLQESEFKFITSKNLVNGKINFNEVKYINEKDYNKFNERSKVNYGDILMPMIGTVGNPVIVDIEDENIDFAIKNVALIKFYKNSKVNNIYVKNLLSSDSFNRMLELTKKGGTQQFVTLKDIRNFKIKLPPIELQNQFAEFVKQIDKQKILLEKQKQNYEKLKKGLMQKLLTGKVRVKI